MIGKLPALGGEGLSAMITNLLNFLLDAVGGFAAGSSGYHIQPGTLPFGS
ncbi:hypothetical protein [Nocardia harenae]|nr:hypothetical protein [Nocardia harenae]